MISVCMIVKNEEKVLSECLESIRANLGKVIDDIVIVDTGSIDGTKKIAKDFDCQIFDFKWCNDFSKARNFSVENAKNDWVMILDADETIGSVLIDELIAIQKKEYEDLRCLVKIKDYDDDGNLMGVTNTPRIFNRKHYEYKNNIHEQISAKNNKPHAQYILNLEINHNGYSESAMVQKNKIERNKELILEYLKENPNEPYMNAQLGITYFQEGKMQEAIETLEKYVFNENYVNTDMYTHFVIAYLSALISLEAYDAVVVCENLWSYCGKNDRYVYLMAVAYIKTNSYEKAVETLLICVNWQGDSFIDKKQCYYLLGQIFEIFGEKEKAMKCYTNASSFADSDNRLNKIKETFENN